MLTIDLETARRFKRFVALLGADKLDARAKNKVLHKNECVIHRSRILTDAGTSLGDGLALLETACFSHAKAPRPQRKERDFLGSQLTS